MVNRNEIFMIGHAHLDAVWLWSWMEAYQEARATLRSAVQLLQEDDDYVFTLEQVVFLSWIEENDPTLFEQIKTLVAQRRIILAGGWWVEPDANLPSLESFVRQGLYGQRYLMTHFNRFARIAFNIDSFGHSAALPQIVLQQGLQGYCFLRPAPHESDQPHTLFRWQGLDGSRVTAYRIPHEYCSPENSLSDHMRKATRAIVPTEIGSSMIFYGVGNHGGGPTRENLASIKELADSGEYGKLILAEPEAYFQKANRRAADLPVWEGELQRHAAGTYSTLSDLKKLHLEVENLLLEAERYSVIASRIFGWPYPYEQLETAWKDLLFVQFHDILPGTSIESAHQDADRQLSRGHFTAQTILNKALQRIANHIDIPLAEAAQPILVFNPHFRGVRQLVEVELAFQGGDWSIVDADGTTVVTQYSQPEATINQKVDSRGLSRRRIMFYADVPAFGYSLYTLRGAGAPAPCRTSPVATVNGHTLENPNIRVTLNSETGWIASVEDLRSGTVVEVPVSRPHSVISEDLSDTWGHGVETYVTQGPSFSVDRCIVEEKGPLRSSIQVQSSYGNSTLIETFSLGAEDRHIRVDVTLDWREKLSLLKLRFPLGQEAKASRYQSQYGYIDRPSDGKEYPGHRWVKAISEKGGPIDFTIINNAKYSYDSIDGEIGMTVVRSPVYAWHEPKRLEDDVQYTYQDQGIQKFSYLIALDAADGEGIGANHLAEELMMPLRTRLESFQSGTLGARKGFLSQKGGKAVSLMALKMAEDSPEELILRLVNNSCLQHKVEFTGDLLKSASVKQQVAGFEIRTLSFTDSRGVRERNLLELDPKECE